MGIPFMPIVLHTKEHKAVLNISSLSAVNFGTVISVNLLKSAKLALSTTDFVRWTFMYFSCTTYIAWSVIRTGSAPKCSMSSSSNIKAFKATITYVGIGIFPFAGRAEFVACVLFTKSSISASEVARIALKLLTNLNISSVVRLRVRTVLIGSPQILANSLSIWENGV